MAILINNNTLNTIQGFPARGAGSSITIWDSILGKPNFENIYAQINHNHDASAITGGTFNVDRIPQLTISKITDLQNSLNNKVNKWEIWNSDLTVSGITYTNNVVFNGVSGGTGGGGGGASVWGLISGTLSDQTDLQNALNNKANSSISLTAGNGLTGGGNLTTNRTFSLGTPSTVGNGSTNSVSSTSHSHAISLVASDIPNLDTSKITSGTFANARISASSVTQHLGNYVDRTTAQDIGGLKNFTSNLRISGQGLLIGTSTLDTNRSIQSVRSNSNIWQIDSNATRFLLEAGQEFNTLYSRNLSNGNAPFRIQIGTTDRLSINNDGLHNIRANNINAIQVRNVDFSSTDSTGEVAIQFGFSNHIGAKISGIKRATNVTDLAFFGENGFNNAVERMRIQGNNGRVGINISNPAQLLHVNGVGRIDEGILVNTNTLDAGRSFQSSFSGNNYIQLDGNSNRYIVGLESGQCSLYSRTTANGNLPFRIVIGTTERFQINANGNVGINKVPVSGRALDVNGVVFASNFVIN